MFTFRTNDHGRPFLKGARRHRRWGDMLFNYGAFPQTWEDPKHVSEDTGCPGDNARTPSAGGWHLRAWRGAGPWS